MKHLYRHKITATFERELPYDIAKPETYTDALKAVADIRDSVTGLGGTITHDAGRPVTVRDKP